jgi:hypothetical protein
MHPIEQVGAAQLADAPTVPAMAAVYSADSSWQVGSVVYLCDGSGSMLNLLPTLKAELRKAVDALSPRQSFNVVFFQGDETAPLSNTLLTASPQNKNDCYMFLHSVSSTGSGDPVPALRLTFAQRPQLVYLVTDGNTFDDNDAVLHEVRRLNAAQLTTVNTVAVLDPRDGEARECKDFLRAIATENGGTFQVIWTSAR